MIILIVAECVRGITSLNLNREFGVWQKYASSSLNLLLHSSKANVTFCCILIPMVILLMTVMFSDCTGIVFRIWHDYKNKEERNKKKTTNDIEMDEHPTNQ